jgi:hypothetical protein
MVQIVYTLLAASFLIGFVIFGVGTGGLGSISDIFSGGGGGSTSSVYDSQVSHAQDRLKKDPKDTAALSQLATAEYRLGQLGITQDSTTGQITISNDATSHFSAAIDAWGRYLKVAKKPDPVLAGEVAQAYLAINDPAGAARAQRIFARAQPNLSSLAQLATFLYFAGDFKSGDRFAKQAIAKAPPSARRTAKGELAQRRSAAKKYVAAQKAAAKAQNGSSGAGGTVGNPFSGLSPTTTQP